MEKYLYQYHKLIDAINHHSYKTILDIGCGDAEEACFFAEHLNMRVTAIDEFEGYGSDCTFDSVRKKIAERGLSNSIELTKMDARELNNISKTFDIVFAHNTLHHIYLFPHSKHDDVRDFFKKVRSLLSMDGLLYISESGRFNFWDRLSRFGSGTWYLNADKFRTIRSVEFSKKTPHTIWIAHIEKPGFTQIELEYYVPFPYRHFRKLLRNKYTNVFLESNYSITAYNQRIRNG